MLWETSLVTKLSDVYVHSDPSTAAISICQASKRPFHPLTYPQLLQDCLLFHGDKRNARVRYEQTARPGTTLIYATTARNPARTASLSSNFAYISVRWGSRWRGRGSPCAFPQPRRQDSGLEPTLLRHCERCGAVRPRTEALTAAPPALRHPGLPGAPLFAQASPAPLRAATRGTTGPTMAASPQRGGAGAARSGSRGRGHRCGKAVWSPLLGDGRARGASGRGRASGAASVAALRRPGGGGARPAPGGFPGAGGIPAGTGGRRKALPPLLVVPPTGRRCAVRRRRALSRAARGRG